jgi:transposase-like protein
LTRRSWRSSRGLSTRDIEAHLEEIYGVKVGRDLISRVTDAVMDDVRDWGKRPLQDVYPVVFLGTSCTFRGWVSPSGKGWAEASE